eukprot:TRINITY_DN30054_c0_g1_i1.p1 TRINITY_DN30054_c0_g1~~TRINITY_DN30054_c0_g1_i1.p1  ORF type:complete len:123 (-),score=31.90 TRINITY_DN30054_c0_g1_i1:61-429(-)
MCIRNRLRTKSEEDLVKYLDFFFQAEDGIRDHAQSRGLGDVYKRQVHGDSIVSLLHAFYQKYMSSSIFFWRDLVTGNWIRRSVPQLSILTRCFRVVDKCNRAFCATPVWILSQLFELSLIHI